MLAACIFSVPHTHRKRVLDLLELESWTVVICCVGARNQTQALCRKKLELVNAKPSLQPFNVYVFNAMLYATQKIVS